MSTGQPYKKALDDLGIALSIYTTILFNYTFQHIYSNPLKGIFVNSAAHITPRSCYIVNLCMYIFVNSASPRNRLDSSVGRASAFGAGGRELESHSRTIPKV